VQRERQDVIPWLNLSFELQLDRVVFRAAHRVGRLQLRIGKGDELSPLGAILAQPRNSFLSYRKRISQSTMK